MPLDVPRVTDEMFQPLDAVLFRAEDKFVLCLRCGCVVLDVPTARETHEGSHATIVLTRTMVKP